MKLRLSLTAMLVLALASVAVAAPPDDTPMKQEAVASVETHQAELVNLADQVWGFAETALREYKSSKLLADYAEKQGFQVERGVAGMPTAFVASYGEGRPIIGILGEYDALPGLSQKAQPTRSPLTMGAPGHGCGHNLFGAASMGAAVALKELIEAGKLKGTIRFYGTPAEEAVGGKVYMARAGLFNDLDVALAWHPEDETRVDVDSTQALVDFIVEFHGKAAHAAFDPWNGRSALDAAELFTHGVNMLREHVKPTVRMHYVFTDAGKVPNVVPEYAKVWMWVRDSKRTGVEEVLARVRKIAEGAALMAGVTSDFTVQAGDYEMLVNQTGARVLQANLEWVGPIQYTPEEEEFARTLQQSNDKPPVGMDSTIHPLEKPKPDPPGGSTDVADVSWNVPTLHISVTTAPKGVPWHSWAVVASGGMSIGHKGMLEAAKVLAATMVDLFANADVRQAIRAEFDEATQGQVYKPFIPDGPPPIPDAPGTSKR